MKEFKSFKETISEEIVEPLEIQKKDKTPKIIQNSS